jgi:hypothetical protein
VAEEKVPEVSEDHNGEGFLLPPRTPFLSFAEAPLCSRDQNQGPPAPQVAAAVEKSCAPASVQKQERGQSVPASNVNSLSLDKMFIVIAIAQQILIEFNGAGSEEAKVVAITKIF